MSSSTKILGTIAGVAAVALMYWAVAYRGADVRLSIVELLLVLIGGLGVALMAATYAFSRDLANFPRDESPRRATEADRHTSFPRDGRE